MRCRPGGARPLFWRIDPKGWLTDQLISDRSVAWLVQKYAGAMGIDPCAASRHSLRAGFMTEAVRMRASLTKMQEVLRHKKVDVLLGYVR